MSALVSRNPKIPAPAVDRCPICSTHLRRSRVRRNRIVCPVSPHFILDWSREKGAWLPSSLPYPI